MEISAHRGASAERPENTLAAFARALDLGAEGVELDVRLSADCVAMVMHDPTVDRTTNGAGAVSRLGVRALQRLDAGDGEPVPTLGEALDLLAGQARVNIEIKDPAAVRAVIAATAVQPRLDWFASSSDWSALRELRRVAPYAVIYPLSVGRPDRGPGPGGEEALKLVLDAALAFAAEVGARGISIWEGGLHGAEVEEVHARGLEAWAWTVDDASRARELIAAGVDALCTDDPALLRSVRDGVAPHS